MLPGLRDSLRQATPVDKLDYSNSIYLLSLPKFEAPFAMFFTVSQFKLNPMCCRLAARSRRKVHLCLVTAKTMSSRSHSTNAQSTTWKMNYRFTAICMHARVVRSHGSPVRSKPWRFRCFDTKFPFMHENIPVTSSRIKSQLLSNFFDDVRRKRSQCVIHHIYFFQCVNSMLTRWVWY